MIARICGKVIEVSFTEVILDVNGVGYRVFIPMSTFDKVPHPGEDMTLLTHMHVREDAIHLYGFATEQEKKLFELLITVSGVGARIAVNILSCMPVSSFCSSVSNGDTKALAKINGIGKRSAERLVVELKDKVRTIAPETAFASTEIEDSTAVAAEEAILALEQLGFKREKIQKIIRKIISEIPEDECSSENLIRKALQSLNT